MKEKLLPYGNFKTEWRAGSKNLLADALSRSPVKTHEDEEDQELEVSCGRLKLRAVELGDEDGDLILQKTIEASKADPDHRLLHGLVQRGFPKNRKDLPDEAKPFYNIRDYLSVDGDLVLYNGRIVIPRGQRKEILGELHAAH